MNPSYALRAAILLFVFLQTLNSYAQRPHHHDAATRQPAWTLVGEAEFMRSATSINVPVTSASPATQLQATVVIDGCDVFAGGTLLTISGFDVTFADGRHTTFPGFGAVSQIGLPARSIALTGSPRALRSIQVTYAISGLPECQRARIRFVVVP